MKIMLGLLCALVCVTVFAQSKTPTQLSETTPYFSDDINFENLEIAIDRQLVAYKSRQAKTVQFGAQVYTVAQLSEALNKFKTIIKDHQDCLKLMPKANCLKVLNSEVIKYFDIYRPVSESQSHFTSYYSPDLHGSFTKNEEYKYGVYTLPKGELRTKYTRNEILLDEKLESEHPANLYVKNELFDIYLFHVEGGGRVQIETKNGLEYRYLSYQGSNSKSFSMIYRYMLDQGMLEPGQASIENQRLYLRHNPESVRDVFATCPSFIYFKITDHEPLGIDNIPLTEQRSIALDRNHYKLSGILSFIQSRKPVLNGAQVEHKDFSRFYLHQDTGGAIRGTNRADLYAGFGKRAEVEANYTNVNDGSLFFLLPKIE